MRDSEGIKTWNGKTRICMNSTGRLAATISDVKHALTRQMFRPIKWEQLMSEIYAYRSEHSDFPRTVVIGPPKNPIKTLLAKTNYLAARKLDIQRKMIEKRKDAEVIE